MSLDMITVIRKEKGMSIEELSEKSGVPLGTLSKISAGITKDPKLETVKAIARALQCTLSDLDDDDLANRDNASLEEMKLIKKYRLLNDYSQETISYLLDREVKKSENSPEVPVTYEIGENNIIPFKPRDIDIYGKASAGGGFYNFDKENPIKTTTVNYVPSRYDLAFEISGDSMKPAFEDGEVVFVLETPEAHNGMVGIVEINKELFIKKIYMEEDGMRLVSFNTDVSEDGTRVYPDLYADELDEIYVIGRVIN